MGARIEWASLQATTATLHAPGEARDDHGNTNDLPALFAGDGVVIEGEAEAWLTFALDLADEARDWIESEKGEGQPTSIADLVAAVRVPLVRYYAIESDGDPGYHDRADQAFDLIERARALVDALDPKGVAS